MEALLREAAYRTRLTADEERASLFHNRLIMQPALDESRWKLWGGLDGVIGAIVDRALSSGADNLPLDPGAPNDIPWRRAMALAQLCLGDQPESAQITVFVDAEQATASTGEAGVYLEAGPRIGRDALRGILCDAVIEVTVTHADGEPMRYGRRSRTIPASRRRAIIHRDGNRCVIDGCRSRNRLQIHHLVPPGVRVAEPIRTI